MTGSINYEEIDKCIKIINVNIIANKSDGHSVGGELWRKFLFQYNIQKISDLDKQAKNKCQGDLGTRRTSHLVILKDLIADFEQPKDEEIKEQLKGLLQKLTP